MFHIHADWIALCKCKYEQKDVSFDKINALDHNRLLLYVVPDLKRHKLIFAAKIYAHIFLDIEKISVV